MKFGSFFLLTVAFALIVVPEQSNGLSLNTSLCLNVSNTLIIGCPTGKTPIENTTNPSGSGTQKGESADPVLVLKKGFMDCNDTLAAAATMALNGLTDAERLLIDQPSSAADAAIQGVNAGKNRIFDAGVSVLQCLGEASSNTNEAGIQGLASASQKLQVVGLEAVSQMRNVINLVNQASSIRGEAGKQALKAAKKVIEASFGAMYNTIPESLQQAIEAVSNSTGVSVQTRALESQISEAAAKDSDYVAAISGIRKAADNSIREGSSADDVNKLRDSIIKTLNDLAQVASQERDYFEYIQKLADTDPSLAKKIFLQDSEESQKKIQNIFAYLILNLGAAGVNYNSSSKKQIGQAIQAAEHGNDDVTLGGKIAVELTLYALRLKGIIRVVLFNAAKQSARQGKIALNQRIGDAAAMSFKALRK